MLKRKVLTIISTICTVLAGYAQLVVGEHATALDSITGTYLCSIDESLWGNDLTTTITSPVFTEIKVNGTVVKDSCTFAQIDGNKSWNISATMPDGTTREARLQFTFLPIVEINGKVEKNIYNTGSVNVLLPDEDITSPCRMKFRGSSTNSHVYYKRNYHLKFIDENGEKADYKFFTGMRNDNSWLLDAGTLDRLRVRNRVLTDLWLDINSKPYYAEQEPKALNGARGRMVEVFRNGEYQGVYNMSEAIDRKQLKLKKTDETTGTINGQLWKAGVRSNVTKMWEAPMYDNNSDSWSGMEVQYPDFDDVNPTDYSTIYNVVNFIANCDDHELVAHASEYIDMPVLIDIFVFTQLMCAYDNVGKNIYWATYDRNEGPMVTPIPWDFDTSLGQPWKTSEYHPEYLNPDKDTYTDFGSNLDRFLSRMITWNVSGFVDKGTQRYIDLRKTVLNTDSVVKRFTSCIDMLKKSGAAAREEQRWVKSYDLGGRSVDFDTELAFVTDWITKRLDWLDRRYFVPRLGGDVYTDGVLDVSDLNYFVSQLVGKGKTPAIYIFKYDMNEDQEIDVNDVNLLINKLLGK